MKKLILIFTRDFNLWEHQMIRNQYVRIFPKVWGKGLTDQVVHFTGRSFEWLRYEDEAQKLKAYMVAKPLDSYIFLPSTHRKFLSDVKKLKRLLVTPPARIPSPTAHLEKLTELFRAMYPIYTLAVFLPGAWREAFMQSHGKDGERVMQLVYASRHKSEGVITLVGGHLRAWLGQKIAAKKNPADYLKLLTVDEVERVVRQDKLPSKAELAKRAKGFVYLGDRVYPATNFERFLRSRKIKLIKTSRENANISEVKGSPAFSASKLTGIVQTLYNENEVSSFKTGRILITPMTSPSFLPAMRKAKAIVTDEGGISSHAAIVAREIKKPCVIGTKIATRVFKDGDLVEVDAKRGIVRKIEK